MSTNREIVASMIHADANTCISINNRYVAFGQINTVKVFDLSDNDSTVQEFSGTGDFGWSVSLNETKILAGAPGESSIYLFDITDNDRGSAMTQTQNRVADNLGYSVSLGNDNKYVASSPKAVVNDGTNPDGGYVMNHHNYDINTSQNEKRHVFYGRSVSINGDFALITSYKYLSNSNFRTLADIVVVDDLSLSTHLIPLGQTPGRDKDLSDYPGEGEQYLGHTSVLAENQYGTKYAVVSDYNSVDDKQNNNEGIWIWKKTSNGGTWDEINENLPYPDVKFGAYGKNAAGPYTKGGGGFGRCLSASGNFMAVGGVTNKVYVFNTAEWNEGDPMKNATEITIDGAAHAVSIYEVSNTTNTYNLAIMTENKVILKYTVYTEPEEPTDEFESEIIGDPYIKPMHGPMYKLPDIEANYRILESKTVIINAQVQKVEQDYINNYAQTLNDEHFKDVHSAIYDWESMYFFTQICIHYDGEIAIYDLLKGHLIGECPTWLILSELTNNTESSSMYKNEHVVKNVELSIATVLTIQAALYVNPQVLTGIKVKKFKGNPELDGLLMYKYSSESAQVKSLYDTSNCSFVSPVCEKDIYETFFTNDGTHETKKIQVV